VTGRTLGNYQLLDPLGSGGMGHVYKARDTRLNRLVAIKILREDAFGNATRMQRFMQEAKSTSALNHPNIVHIYDIFESDGMNCLVMEYIAGKTLHDLIPKRGMQIKDVLRIGVQIADGLSCAHKAGVIHRDIKPSNVIVPDSGAVRIVDFGIAKQAGSDKMSDDETTHSMNSLTEEGVVLGTVSYMSPEQAQGKPIDRRSDIFSFGSVLYEMLTGQRAFHADTKVGTLAAILHRDPAPLGAPGIPRPLERLVSKCLRKNPEERWQDLADVKLMIEDMTTTEPELRSEAGKGASHRFAWMAVVAAALVGAAITYGAVRYFSNSSSSQTAANATLRKITTDAGLTGYPAISRDGKFVAFASDRAKEDNLDIWVQQIGGGGAAIRLTRDPADESDPTFSPDGTMIAFRSEKDGGGIYAIPSLGGTPILLAQRGRNPRFSPDGRWVAYSSGGGEVSNPGSAGVFIVSSGGGAPRAIHSEMATATSPVWSPESDRLLVLGRKDGNAPARAELDWWILPIDNGTPVRSEAYMRLNTQNLTRSQFPQVYPAALDWRRDGSEDRILFSAYSGDSANLWEIPLKGTGAAQRVTFGPGLHGPARWSGDAGRFVFAAAELSFDIWLQPLDAASGAAHGEVKRLTGGAGEELTPSISWDGKRIAYVSHRSENWSLRVREPAGDERTLLSSPTRIPTALLAGDGSRILYTNESDLFSIPSAGGAVQKLCEHCGVAMGASTDGSEISYEPAENEDALMYDSARRTTVKLAQRPSSDLLFSGTRFSRDGKWVAFHALRNAMNTAQIWIAPVGQSTPTPQSQWIGVTDGSTMDRDPAWSPDGRFLYFVSERDGFRCIWARALNPATKQPSGEPFAVRHFHSARFSLRHVGSQGFLTGLSAGEGTLVFSMGERKANVWLEEPATAGNEKPAADK
jgi:Tol biopolymer transport system component/tRNA A-37 threonylcarbamoyl transferase component Bud32